MAVLVGVATGLLGEYSKMLIDLFTALNDLFLKITTLIIKAMPVAVFCSILSMMLTMGFSKILSVLGMMGTFIAGLICLSVLLVQLDVPVGAIGLVIGIESLCGMFRTMNNCLGDVAMTIIVAKSENAIDMNVYNGD